MTSIDELMTADEHEAMRLTGELASLVHKIIGDGPQAEHDWAEFTVRIHACQHMIMRQCAARAFPDLYRRLGQTIASGKSGLALRPDAPVMQPSKPTGT